MSATKTSNQEIGKTIVEGSLSVAATVAKLAWKGFLSLSPKGRAITLVVVTAVTLSPFAIKPEANTIVATDSYVPAAPVEVVKPEDFQFYKKDGEILGFSEMTHSQKVFYLGKRGFSKADTARLIRESLQPVKVKVWNNEEQAIIIMNAMNSNSSK